MYGLHSTDIHWTHDHLINLCRNLLWQILFKSEKNKLLNSNECKLCIQNFNQLGHNIWQVTVTIQLCTLVKYNFCCTDSYKTHTWWRALHGNLLQQISPKSVKKKNMEIAQRNSSVRSSKLCFLLHWFSCNLTTTERNSHWISCKSDKLINQWH